MSTFRKKPVTVEAVRFTNGKFMGDIPRWLAEAGLRGEVAIKPDGSGFSVATLEGQMSALPGNWIIRGVKGELYPCAHDIFTDTYEAVTECASDRRA